MPVHRFLCTLLFAAAFIGTNVQAQTDHFSLNFEEIVVDYHSARPGALPFALDLVHGEHGAIRLRPISTHNLTFKRGQFYPADPQPESWLFFDMQASRGGAVGLLAIGIDQSAGTAGGGPHVRVFDGVAGGASTVHIGGAHVLMGDGSVRFINHSVDVSLCGEPKELFNSPGPGEPLEARLPTPAVRQTIELKLTVSDNHGASMTLPVRIRRPR
jgi:prepilin-type processing-associated H-X9-DG protein